MSKILELAIAIKGKLDGSLTQSTKGATTQIKDLQQQINKANKEILQYQKLKSNPGDEFGRQKALEAIKANEEKITELTAKRVSIQSKVDAKATAQDNFLNASKNLGKAVAVGAVAAAPIMLATKAAMGFESAMADVRKTVDFDSPEGLAQMQKDIVNMSMHMPMAAEGIAQIVAAGGQAGIAAKDLSAFAEGAVKMGIAFDISADEAGTMMAQWRTAFGMNQGQVETLADQINYLSNTTAASSSSISDVVTRIGPLAQTAGLSASEVAALGASITGTGTGSEIAATGLKNMMLALTAGASATETQAGAFEALGLDATEMAQRMQVDAQGAIVDVLQRLRELPEAEQAATMKQLFGKESIAAIAPLLTQLDALKGNLEKVGDASQYAGSMQKEYEARISTTENQLQMAENAVKALAINIGSALLPSVSSALNTVAQLAGEFAKWAEQNQGIVQTLVAVGAGILGVIIACFAIQTVVEGWRLLKATIDLFTVSQEGATLATRASTAAAKAQAVATRGLAMAQGALNAVMAINPFVAIAVAVVALIAALVYLWNTNESFREAVISAWEAIKSAVSTAIDVIVDVMNNLPYYIGYAIGATTSFLMELPVNLGIMAAEFLTGVFAWIASTYDAAVNGIGNMVDGVSNFLANLPENCASAGAAFVQAASEWGANAYQAVMDWISQIPSAITNSISGAWESAKASVMGGFTAGFSGKKFANGGVVTSPTVGIIGEAGYPEVVVPIDGSSNAYNLLETAANMLGVSTATAPIISGPVAPKLPSVGGQGSGSMNITFAPQITVQGGQGSENDIAKILDDKMREFERMMNEYQSGQRRLSYE